MSPFLSGLIERASGAAPMLERRTRSLFEPEPGAAATPVSTAMESSETVESPPPLLSPATRSNQAVPAVPTPAARAAAENTGPDPAPPRRRRAAPAIEAAAVGSEPAPVPLPPPALKPATLRTRFEPRADAAPLEHPPAAVAAPPVTSVLKAKPMAAPAVVEPHTPVEKPALRREPRKPEAGEDPSLRLRALTRPRPEPAALPQTAHPVPESQRAVAPSVLLARVAQRSLPQAEPANQPPPVHISIGRVEVRAASGAPERSRERKPGGPRLSLDDYLRGRNGGGR